MAGPIPDPPINAPFPGAAPNFGRDELCSVSTWTYQPDRGGWTFYDVANFAANSWPLGYYRTPLDFLGIPAFFVVTLREAAGGSGLPYVTAPQDSPVVQELNCPDGFGIVDVSEVNLGPGGNTLNSIAYWFYEKGITQLCARLAVQKVPTCPPGTMWDPTTETCKPIVVIPPPPPPPPPPTCPPGTTWDPVSQTCQPNPPPPPPPPGNPPPCPPFTTQPDCLPTAPGSDPDNDELGDGFTQLAYWLQIQATWMMNIYQWLSSQQPGKGGGCDNPDPVTCAQLTQQVLIIVGALNAIAKAIAAQSSGGGTAPLLTEIIARLQAIANAIANRPAETTDPNVKRIADELDASASQAKLNAVVQRMIDDGTIDPSLGQVILS